MDSFVLLTGEDIQALHKGLGMAMLSDLGDSYGKQPTRVVVEDGKIAFTK